MSENRFRFEGLERKFGERSDVPEIFQCPISQSIMKDPVILPETGQTYERNQIEEWFKEHTTDPMTNQELKSQSLVENIALRNAIEEFKKTESRRQSFQRSPHYSCTSTRHRGRTELKHSFKVSAIGPPGVGKTSLIRRLCYGEWDAKLKPTVVLDIEFVVVKVGDSLVRLCFWDTAGQDRFNSVMFNHIRGSDAVLTVFDLSNAETLYDAEKYLQEAPTDDALLFLVGNKADLLKNEEMKATIAIGQLFADNNSMIFFKTSAKNSTNIKDLLLKIARSLSAMSNRKKKPSVISLEPKTSSKIKSDQSDSSEKCCRS